MQENNSHGHLLLCTTSFKSIKNPQNMYSFRTQLCPFPCRVKKQPAKYCHHSQQCIWGVEDIPGDKESLRHHHRTTKSWGLASLAVVFAPLAPVAGLIWAASAAPSVIASWFDSFPAALHWSQNQLNRESDFHSAKQLEENVLFLLSPEVSFCTLNTPLGGKW